MSDTGLVSFLSATQSLLASITAAVSKRRVRRRIRRVSRVEQTRRRVLLPLDGLTRGVRHFSSKRRQGQSFQGDDVGFHRITTAQDDRRDPGLRLRSRHQIVPQREVTLVTKWVVVVVADVEPLPLRPVLRSILDLVDLVGNHSTHRAVGFTHPRDVDLESRNIRVEVIRIRDGFQTFLSLDVKPWVDALDATLNAATQIAVTGGVVITTPWEWVDLPVDQLDDVGSEARPLRSAVPF